MLKYLYKAKRKTGFWLNRIRSNYKLRKKDGNIRAVIPERHRKKITFLKYLFTVVGLFSGFIVFTSVLIGFGFGLVIFLISSALELIAYQHPYLFIHPLPDFEIEPDKWVGVGFGYYAGSSQESGDVPIVSMMITDLEYAKKLASLFLKWTGGTYHDKQKNIHATAVVTGPNEYIFMFHPSLRRPIAQRFFQSAKDKLRRVSLADEIAEHQALLSFGKKCAIGPVSYFPEFRQRHRAGVPVMFEFLLPPFDKPRPCSEIPPFILFDFSIKDKAGLTRKDTEYEMVKDYEIGGKWQGPEHLRPANH